MEFPLHHFVEWIGILVFGGQFLGKLSKCKLYQSSTQIWSVLLDECLQSELIQVNCHSDQDVDLEKEHIFQEGLLGVNWEQICNSSLAAVADRGLSHMLLFREKLQAELSAFCTVFLLCDSWHCLLTNRTETYLVQLELHIYTDQSERLHNNQSELEKQTNQNSGIGTNPTVQIWIPHLHKDGLIRNQGGNFLCESLPPFVSLELTFCFSLEVVCKLFTWINFLPL